MADPIVLSIMSPVSLTSFYSPEDGSVRQARLWFYKTQTLDPVPVYTDSDLRLPHSQPVLSGGSGRVPPVFVGEIGQYRVRAFDEFDVLLEDIDGLPPATAGGSGGGGGGGTTDPNLLVKTGQVTPFYASQNQTIVGYVRLNGGTISPTAGPGTERANDDAMALFKWLWAADPTLAVIPSRGTTSDGDWTAAKAITLPDFRGRSVYGMDGVGFSNVNRLAGITFAKGDQTTIGSYGGGPAIKTLSLAELPSHNHSITDPGHYHYSVVPAHAHSWSGGYTDSQGSHTHTGATDTEAAHTHQYLEPQGGSTGVGGANMPGAAYAQTGAGGAHSHALTINAGGAHTHNVYGNVVSNGPWGVNSDTKVAGITSVAVGSNTPFQLMDPFVLVSWFIKL